MAARIVPLALRQQLLTQFARGRQISPCHVENTKRLEGGPTLIGFADRPGQLAYPPIGLLDRSGGEFHGGQERRA